MERVLLDPSDLFVVKANQLWFLRFAEALVLVGDGARAGLTYQRPLVGATLRTGHEAHGRPRTVSYRRRSPGTRSTSSVTTRSSPPTAWASRRVPVTIAGMRARPAAPTDSRKSGPAVNPEGHQSEINGVSPEAA